MNFPICVTNICVTNGKQTTSFGIAGLMLAIAPLWLIAAAAGTSVHAQTTSSPADWTQFHRDNMQRWNPYETVLGVNNAASLQLQWSYATYDELEGSQTDSSPAVVNGVVYIGSGDGLVSALNATTGTKLWSYSIGSYLNGSPAVANGVVYVGSDLNDIVALNSNTGSLLWSYTLLEGVQSSPTVANGVVYICSDADRVYALNASTGSLLWVSGVEGLSGSTPAVANGVVYVGSNVDGLVSALNANTGALLWSYTTGDAVQSSPAVANGVVYVGSNDGNVYALNASTGAKLWSYKTGGIVYSSPAVANGVVYVGSNDGNVYALNASTGAKLWSYDTGNQESASSPAVANGVVYIGSGDSNGSIYALNANTGAKLWSYATECYLVSSPAVVDGVVYVGSAEGGINRTLAFGLAQPADLYLRIRPTPATVAQGDLLTYAFPVWDLGPGNAVHEVLTTRVPEGTTLDYVRISGTPGLGTCTTPPYEGTGEIVCHENSAMAPNTTWTVRVVVKVTAPSGTVITENATVTEDTPDPNLANNTATVSTTVQ
jgi:outer membrane protein assembly factor BamB